jgi:exodeoxyribonuclease-5
LLDYENLEIDTKIILNTLNIETASLDYEAQKKLYYSIAEDYPNIKNKRNLMLKIRENPYFNALQVKFAYAITCHKAQGGQWKNVFIDHGYLTEDMINKDFLRWLYTAFTRATNRVYLVNFKKDFFV